MIPILVTLVGIATDVKDVHDKKAAAPLYGDDKSRRVKVTNFGEDDSTDGCDASRDVYSGNRACCELPVVDTSGSSGNGN